MSLHRIDNGGCGTVVRVTTGVCVRCGHAEALHVPVGQKTCLAQTDTRTPTTGGSGLAPCSCPGFAASALSRTATEPDGWETAAEPRQGVMR